MPALWLSCTHVYLYLTIVLSVCVFSMAILYSSLLVSYHSIVSLCLLYGYLVLDVYLYLTIVLSVCACSMAILYSCLLVSYHSVVSLCLLYGYLVLMFTCILPLCCQSVPALWLSCTPVYLHLTIVLSVCLCCMAFLYSCLLVSYHCVVSLCLLYGYLVLPLACLEHTFHA